MDKNEFKKIYKKYNEFDTLNDRFRFCMEVLKSCNCNEISKACDIPLTTVTRIRDGKIANPNPVYLYSIAMFFGVNYQWLVESKYFPFSRINNKYNCLTPDKNGLIDFHNLQADSKSGIIFKDIDEYKKAFEAFIMYKDFIPILINCIDENKFLEKVENANFEKIIFQINFLNQVKKHNDNDMQQLARKVRNSIISYEKLMEMMNDFEKRIVLIMMKEKRLVRIELVFLSCLNAIEHRQNMLEHTTINANNNKGTIIFGDGNTIKNEK